MNRYFKIGKNNFNQHKRLEVGNHNRLNLSCIGRDVCIYEINIHHSSISLAISLSSSFKLLLACLKLAKEIFFLAFAPFLFWSTFKRFIITMKNKRRKNFIMEYIPGRWRDTPNAYPRGREFRTRNRAIALGILETWATKWIVWYEIAETA